jgi:hypothetical protein
MTPETEDELVRRVLGAAAARPDELPEIRPFLAERARALAAHTAGVALGPVALVAWHALPVLVLLLTLLVGVVGLDASRPAEDDNEEAIWGAVVQPASSADAALASLLVTDVNDAHGKGSQ